MNFDKEKIKLATLSFSIIALAVILLTYIYSIRVELEVTAQYKHQLKALQKSNFQIDKQIQKKITLMNYDNINQKVNDFENILEILQTDGKFKAIVQSRELLSLFESLKTSFEHKKDEIEFYKTQVSSMVNSLHYLPNLHHALLKEGFIYHDKVYRYIMQLAFGESINEQSFYKALEVLSAYESDKEEVLSLFVAHAIFIYEKLSQIQTSVATIESMDMAKSLEYFEQKSDYYLYQGVYRVIDITLMAIGLLLGLSLLSGWLFRKKDSQSRELSYFKKGVDKSDNSVIITDMNRHVIYVNDAFEKISGYRKEDIMGEDARMFHGGTMKESCAMISKTISNGESWFGEFTNLRKDGSKYIEKTSIIPIHNSHGKLKYIMEIKLDITQEKAYKTSIIAKNKEILKRFYHDELTKLYNRQRLLKDMQRNKRYTMILLNINDFKEINDFYGVKRGDEILIHLATVLQTLAKEEGYKAYRLHADEFCLLSPLQLKRYTINNVLLRVEDEINRFTQGSHIYYTFGVGVAYSKFEKPYNEQILVESDLALKHAKKSSNIFELYHDKYKLQNDYENNMAWVQKLKVAIEEERIVPYFQPVVNTQDGSVLYYESLIRMLDTDGKAISPFFFLEVSKKAKLYIQLTQIMIEKSFKVFEDSQDSFSINFSYEDMVEENIMIALEKKIRKMSNPSRFTAEILESESIENYEVVETFIDTLKGYGCNIAIDDFGSGYSNFERLFKLNIDYLKIDGSIVKELDTNHQMKIIAETIIDFAKKSEMKVVAEFVHSGEIVEILESMGVYNHQGFHFSEPLPSPNFMPLEMPVA